MSLDFHLIKFLLKYFMNLIFAYSFSMAYNIHKQYPSQFIRWNVDCNLVSQFYQCYIKFLVY
ncbi:unnamed protein product [Paramecium primaurelia]|uniref:Uncharacterized protein n=1 Tax=Paramecium primaurelia TaxID=5886 RepID=A0A8S1M0P0_PARPR|nr:unnamed protein product [Paramecium primaurelia]